MLAEQIQTDLRQGQRPADPLEQRYAQAFFQSRDLSSKRRLCQAEGARRCRQGTLFRGHQESAGLIPVKIDGLPVPIIHAFMYIMTT